MWRNVFSKFIEICMETPCWCPPRWAPTWRPETSRNICNNNNNLLISSAQVSTIRFSNARYILDWDKHDVYNTLYWQLLTRGFSVTIYNSTGNQIDIAQIAIYNCGNLQFNRLWQWLPLSELPKWFWFQECALREEKTSTKNYLQFIK